MNDVERQLEEARRSLLDLTLRNRLLNYRPSSRRSLRIVDEIPAEIVQRLLLDEKPMWFKPAPKRQSPAETVIPDETAETAVDARDEEDKAIDATGTGDAAGTPDAADDGRRPPEDSISAEAEDEIDTREETDAGVELDPVHETDPGDENAEGQRLTEDESAELWELPEPETAEVAERHRDRYLQTDVKADALQQRLFYIHQQARSVLEEQGYTVLFLALGFLEWKDPEADATRVAPLILIPVDLVRPKVGTAFKVSWTHEEIQTNISLKARLAELGVLIPDFEVPEDKAGIDAYYAAVEEAIRERDGWRVRPDIGLDFFSFTKFVMYKDLDPEAWPGDHSPAEHPLIRTILNPEAGPTPEAGGFLESEIDDVLHARDVYHIMDADPSQIAVIEDVKAGRDLVVEGPPGTGKSQTIANLIAELLAAGKTVLFVSEKMAALEVVKRRLDQAGLGTFCLELHSRKSRKREVLEEMKRALAETPAAPPSRESAFERWEHLRRELNGYAASLREPVGETGLTPFRLYCLAEDAAEHFAKSGRRWPRIPLDGVRGIDPRQLASARARLEELRDALALVHPLQIHPWRGCRPGTVLPADEQLITDLLDSAMAALRALREAIRRLAEVVLLRLPDRPTELTEAIDASRLLAAREWPVERANLLDERWDTENADARDAIDRVAEFQRVRKQVLGRFRPAVLDEDVEDLITSFKELSLRFFRFLSGRYRRLKRKIASLYRGRPPRDLIEWVLDLENAVRCVRRRAEVGEVDEIGRSLFGPVWKGEESDPGALASLGEWLRRFRSHFRAGRFTLDTVDRTLEGVDGGAVEESISAVLEARRTFHAARDRLEQRIGIDYPEIFDVGREDVPYDALESRCRIWREEITSLQSWSRYRAALDLCLATPAKPLVTRLEETALEPDDLLPAFNGVLADAALGVAFSERGDLARFVGALHEKKIEHFRKLDLGLIHGNRRRLKSLLTDRRPPIAGGASPGSEVGILLGEFNRKRGHMPIRQLMLRAGQLVQKIKPCFMMSPLSIAQFLTPETARFDVVVFDEASQVRPEDALGALLRGRQLVVMGDTRQLPPTTFFDHLIDASRDHEDAAEVAASLSDIESILHQCRRSFPVKTLRWHYRSRHESLIAVSNEAFYANRLRIYPSPIQDAEHLGLQFCHLPETRYDRGRSGANRQEARAVAEAAVEHFLSHPNRSLGIGTFNARQQQAILEEVELQLRRRPDLEPCFLGGAEPFFVKNLETIQGDERDVIFLSIGFGYDQQGKLSQNFGPLNQEGGERRLNVLITRARERCVIYCNFRAEDLRVDAASPFGVRALQRFLSFAEHRTTPDEGATETEDARPAASVVAAVGASLEAHGHRVVPRVGCAGFRVDLGVLDPDEPGRFRLGIECDGEKYHTADVARDRDRLRAQVLESLGWRLVRVWSTDWYRNRGDAEKRLLDEVDRLLEEDPDPLDEESGAPARPENAPDRPAEPASASPGAPVPFTPSDGFERVVGPYEVCDSLGMPVEGELTDVPPQVLARAVQRVVEVEGPVHVEVVVRRVRTLWGLKRSGSRVQEALDGAIEHAVSGDQVRREGRYLFPVDMAEVPVRRRSGRAQVKIDLVSDAEASEAVRTVLRVQFATPLPGLVTRTARLLGFQVTTPAVRKRLELVVERLLARGELQRSPTGAVDLVGRT